MGVNRTLILAVAQPLSTRLARWTGRGTPEVRQAAATAGPVTPVPATFAIWAPLFAGSIAYGATVEHTAPSRAWVDAALLGNIAWSLNSQFRRLDEASVALIAASAAAATTAVARDPHPRTRATIGPLAGWLTLATAANVETTLNLRRGRPTGRRETRRAVALLAAAIATAGVVQGRALRGDPGYALALGWGLGGVALGAMRGRRRAVALTAGLGAALVGVITVGSR